LCTTFIVIHVDLFNSIIWVTLHKSYLKINNIICLKDMSALLAALKRKQISESVGYSENEEEETLWYDTSATGIVQSKNQEKTLRSAMRSGRRRSHETPLQVRIANPEVTKVLEKIYYVTDPEADSDDEPIPGASIIDDTSSSSEEEEDDDDDDDDDEDSDASLDYHLKQRKKHTPSPLSIKIMSAKIDKPGGTLSTVRIPVSPRGPINIDGKVSPRLLKKSAKSQCITTTIQNSQPRPMPAVYQVPSSKERTSSTSSSDSSSAYATPMAALSPRSSFAAASARSSFAPTSPRSSYLATSPRASYLTTSPRSSLASSATFNTIDAANHSVGIERQLRHIRRADARTSSTEMNQGVKLDAATKLSMLMAAAEEFSLDEYFDAEEEPGSSYQSPRFQTPTMSPIMSPNMSPAMSPRLAATSPRSVTSPRRVASPPAMTLPMAQLSSSYSAISSLQMARSPPVRTGGWPPQTRQGIVRSSSSSSSSSSSDTSDDQDSDDQVLAHSRRLHGARDAYAPNVAQPADALRRPVPVTPIANQHIAAWLQGMEQANASGATTKPAKVYAPHARRPVMSDARSNSSSDDSDSDNEVIGLSCAAAGRSVTRTISPLRRQPSMPLTSSLGLGQTMQHNRTSPAAMPRHVLEPARQPSPGPRPVVSTEASRENLRESARLDRQRTLRSRPSQPMLRQPGSGSQTPESPLSPTLDVPSRPGIKRSVSAHFRRRDAILSPSSSDDEPILSPDEYLHRSPSIGRLRQSARDRPRREDQRSDAERSVQQTQQRSTRDNDHGRSQTREPSRRTDPNSGYVSSTEDRRLERSNTRSSRKAPEHVQSGGEERPELRRKPSSRQLDRHTSGRAVPNADEPRRTLERKASSRHLDRQAYATDTEERRGLERRPSGRLRHGADRRTENGAPPPVPALPSAHEHKDTPQPDGKLTQSVKGVKARIAANVAANMAAKQQEPSVRTMTVTIYVNDMSQQHSVTIHSNMTTIEVVRLMGESNMLPDEDTTWTIFEQINAFNAERPLADWEILMEVLGTWEPSQNNTLMIRKYAFRTGLNCEVSILFDFECGLGTY
jgi:hypothetical protein